MSNYESVDHFLQKAARIPLLTTEEEIHLARSVQRMIALQQANPTGPYTKTEEAHIRRGVRAKDRFINANIRLVANVAGKYFRSLQGSLDLPQEDMIQEGMFGLVRAVEKFDPERGYKFSTYAYWWIRQSIMRGMQVNGRLVRLPTHIHEKMYTLRHRQHSLAQKLDRQPTITELADDIGLPLETLELVLTLSIRPCSLNATAGTNEGSLMDVIVDEVSSADQLEALSDHLDIERVKDAMLLLPKRERQILELRYGLTGAPPATLHSIGARLGITRERTRQVCAIALRRIESILQDDPQFKTPQELAAVA